MNNFLTKLLLTILGLMVLATGLVFGTIWIAFNNPDYIWWAVAGCVVVYVLLLFLGIRFLQKCFSGDSRLAKKLMEMGKKAPATIVDIEDTAWRRNYNPVVRLSLRVSPTAGAAFDAKLETTFLVYKPLHIGDRIEVIYNPDNLLEIIMAKSQK
jgi:membrane protein implicated in regulation of membrane protease activity